MLDPLPEIAMMTTRQVVRRWSGMGIVTLAAFLGFFLAPTKVVHAEDVGYSCFGNDVCHNGTYQCCSELEDVNPGMGRCSTTCPVIIIDIEPCPFPSPTMCP